VRVCATLKLMRGPGLRRTWRTVESSSGGSTSKWTTVSFYRLCYFLHALTFLSKPREPTNSFDGGVEFFRYQGPPAGCQYLILSFLVVSSNTLSLSSTSTHSRRFIFVSRCLLLICILGCPFPLV